MKQLAIISITDIAVECILGVSPNERSKLQIVYVSLALTIDIAKATKTDCINDTVNYRKIYECVIQTVSESKYYLLEALSSAILTNCFKDKRIIRATVWVKKPNRLPEAKGVMIEISKENE